MTKPLTIRHNIFKRSRKLYVLFMESSIIQALYCALRQVYANVKVTLRCVDAVRAVLCGMWVRYRAVTHYVLQLLGFRRVKGTKRLLMEQVQVDIT